MRIGIDIRTLMDARFSGVSELTFRTLENILKADRKNEYILFYNRFGRGPLRLPDPLGPNVRVVRLHYPNKLFNYLMQKALARPKIDRRIGADVFWMPHINFTALSAGCRSCLTIHDLSFLKYPEYFSLRKNIWHRLVAVRRLMEKAGRIIAVSEHTKADIIELGGRHPDTVSLVYPGFDPAFASAVDAQDWPGIVRKYGLPEGYILSLGNIEPRKNLSGVLAAYEALRRQEPSASGLGLVIAGAPGWKNSAIERAWKESAFKEDIAFTGYVDAVHKPAVYARAAMFAYPSFYEGFGIPILEAMACGTPVLTGSVSSMPEIAGGAAMLVNPFDISEIASGMSLILSDSACREKLVRAGRENIKRFSWEENARQHIGLFENA